ncbi:ataxin-10 [Calliopsis andreniformis]|uniref:ataxin-10 n=1 Tax=Calliopsis andreniformis TaxID=337506 RepID=UPI003FCC3B32
MNSRNIDLLPKFESALSQQNWDKLSDLLDPKLFKNVESKELISFPILAKVAQILTTEDSDIPTTIKIACLKCLGNSCFNGYKHKEYTATDIECGPYCHKLYSILAASNENLRESSNLYSFDSHFPYEGVVEWTSNFIVSYKHDNHLAEEKLEILRLSIQFLCNFFTFACEDSNLSEQCSILKYLNDTNFKSMIINLTHSEHIPLVRASCIFIHNVLKSYQGKIFSELEKTQLCLQLLEPFKQGFESAKEALIFLLHQPNVLQSAYNGRKVEDILCFLEILQNKILETTYSSEEYILPKDAIQFLAERFCRRSDLILGTPDKLLDENESIEIVFLVDILATLTSRSSEEYSFLRSYKSLLINCTYLLKAIQMIGKTQNNCFTPIQKLSDLAPTVQDVSTSNNSNIRNQHTFRFKGELIRIIGNMTYKSKENQDLLREMDAIPLLLDCCNMDARNPFIIQWTILALRNLCEDNPANQDIIRTCTRVGVVENSVLQEMGLTLHENEEGKKIVVVPLPRDKK